MISWNAQKRYVKDCFYTNQESFQKIVDLSRKQYHDGDTYLKIDEESNSDEYRTILKDLREQYQSNSDYPVFTAVDIYYDNEGDLALYIQVKKKKLKNGDGIDIPDIICYDLVYIDEKYDGNKTVKNEKPFYENWYFWSFDTYSG